MITVRKWRIPSENSKGGFFEWEEDPGSGCIKFLQSLLDEDKGDQACVDLDKSICFIQNLILFSIHSVYYF